MSYPPVTQLESRLREAHADAALGTARLRLRRSPRWLRPERPAADPAERRAAAPSPVGCAS